MPAPQTPALPFCDSISVRGFSVSARADLISRYLLADFAPARN